jgi:hypothetical protein
MSVRLTDYGALAPREQLSGVVGLSLVALGSILLIEFGRSSIASFTLTVWLGGLTALLIGLGSLATVDRALREVGP